MEPGWKLCAARRFTLHASRLWAPDEVLSDCLAPCLSAAPSKAFRQRGREAWGAVRAQSSNAPVSAGQPADGVDSIETAAMPPAVKRRPSHAYTLHSRSVRVLSFSREACPLTLSSTEPLGRPCPGPSSVLRSLARSPCIVRCSSAW
jgi:hypothetical protein